MVGGEGHNTGEDDDTRDRYEALEAFAREHWDVTEVTHRWSAHDLMPAGEERWSAKLGRTRRAFLSAFARKSHHDHALTARSERGQ